MNDFFRVLKLALTVCALPVIAVLVASSIQADSGVASGSGGPPAISNYALDRNHVVFLTRDGLTTGQVVAIDSVSKSQSPLGGVDVFFVQRGVVAKHTLTDLDGKFVIDGLSPGAYSFVAASAKGFAAYGLLVKPFEEGAPADEIFAPAVSPRFQALRLIVEKYLPTEVADSLAEPEIPTTLRNEAEIPRGANRVKLQSGVLTGSLSSLVDGQSIADAHVALIQQDHLVAETTSDAEGNFAFSDVKPGAYDFVAVCPTAIAAVGFEAVQDPAQPTAQEPVAESTQPAVQEPQADAVPAADVLPATVESSVLDQAVQAAKEQEGAVEVLEVVVTPEADAAAVADQLEAASDALGAEVIVSDSFSFDGMPLENCGGAVGCGACAGSCGCGDDAGYYGGGGGGAYGMYGPLANLAQLALAGWIISELVDDDNPNVPPPVSPGG